MPTALADIELPKTLLTRLVKSCLPDGTLLQKDTKGALSKASTLFVSYLNATCLDMARSNKHRTVTTEDVFQALELLEFEDFIPVLKDHLAAFQQLRREKRALSQPNRDPAESTVEDHPESTVEDPTESTMEDHADSS